MKKLCSTILLLLLALNTSAVVRAESVSLAEMKARIPQTVSFTINGDAYSVSVNLPDADKMPILLCQSMLFDTTEVRQRYPMGYDAERYVRVADAYWNHKDSIYISYDVGPENALRGRTDVSTRQVLPLGQVPPEVELTPQDVAKIAYNRLVEFGGDPSTDLRAWHTAAMSGKYYMKMQKVSSGEGVSFNMPTIDPKRPVKNASKGAWDVMIAQFIKDIIIFPFRYLDEQGYNPDCYYGAPAGGELYIVDEGLMSIGLNAVTVTDTLVLDSQLASFDTIVASIQQRIDEGQLQSIYGMTLGYTAALVKGDKAMIDNKENIHARYVLTPAWSIEGYDLRDRNKRWTQGYTVPEKDAVLQGTGFSDFFELRFDACTGKPLTRDEYDLEENAQ